MLSRLSVAIVLLFMPFLTHQASAQALEPFKDKLFAYPGILSSEAGGDYLVVDYDEMRDINKRDQVPERRVRGAYVSTGVRKVQKDLVLKSDAGAIRHFVVGRTEGARYITLYLYGQGGSRKQGINDFTFGGNFNRIKNLMAANDGLYLAPDVSDFGDRGTAEVAALIEHYGGRSPGAKIFIACGSMGGAICWRLAGIALERGLPFQCSLQGESTRILWPRQPRHRLSGRKAGSVLPLDPGANQGLSGALRALRDRNARYADPNDRLARNAQLDDIGGAITIRQPAHFLYDPMAQYGNRARIPG